MLVTMPERDRRDYSAGDSHIGELLAAQKRYCELRAPDYLDSTKPPDRAGRGPFPSELAGPIFEDLRPSGDVLELACGPGPLFTSELARHAESVTAVDASPTMLELNRARVANPKVTYVEADLFEWSPDRAYDFVFFGHWLSHIPAARLDDFWDLMRTCAGDHGRVGFIDEDDRAAWMDPDRPFEHSEIARRTLPDGRRFDIIKIFWSPHDLQKRLRSLGWDVQITRVAERFMVGLGHPEGRFYPA
jgi:demethylmenaquinone methyltransferase/2-methoxy-6-polyprenyl-1,4-benzoquinol methylase